VKNEVFCRYWYIFSLMSTVEKLNKDLGNQQEIGAIFNLPTYGCRSYHLLVLSTLSLNHDVCPQFV